jgi:hypothetical protein
MELAGKLGEGILADLKMDEWGWASVLRWISWPL